MAIRHNRQDQFKEWAYSRLKTGASQKVLLVDDDDAVREMTGLTLAAKGFNVTRAANVTEALKFIATEPLDVKITDPAHAES
jgi:DNA-binding NtrC family response regulator